MLGSSLQTSAPSPLHHPGMMWLLSSDHQNTTHSTTYSLSPQYAPGPVLGTRENKKNALSPCPPRAHLVTQWFSSRSSGIPRIYVTMSQHIFGYHNQVVGGYYSHLDASKHGPHGKEVSRLRNPAHRRHRFYTNGHAKESITEACAGYKSSKGERSVLKYKRSFDLKNRNKNPYLIP